MPKIAIVHDHLLEFGGAERVLVALKRIYPDADVFTSLIEYNNLGEHAEEIRSWNVTTSWAQSVPYFGRFFSPLRFLWPFIWESFDFSEYDVVISSSGTMMSKGIITKPHIPHICYLHHPPRNLYYYETAIEWQKFWPIRIYGHLVNHSLRVWDYLSSQRVDYFLANSQETLRRIQKYYRMEGEVLYPPVSIPQQMPDRSSKLDTYIVTSRLARAKHTEILIEAANKKKFPLLVIGHGRDEDYLKSIAGPTVTFAGNISDDEFKNTYSRAKAFLFASIDEEFGIAPIEAMGYGIPVIAYASGGLVETVKPGENGYLYSDHTAQALIEQIEQLESLSDAEYAELSQNARKASEHYSFESFKEQFTKYLDTHINN